MSLMRLGGVNASDEARVLMCEVVVGVRWDRIPRWEASSHPRRLDGVMNAGRAHLSNASPSRERLVSEVSSV